MVNSALFRADKSAAINSGHMNDFGEAVEMCQHSLIAIPERTSKRAAAGGNAGGSGGTGGAAFCAFMGCADPSSQECTDCQGRFNCSQDFDTCSGLPSTGDCN